MLRAALNYFSRAPAPQNDAGVEHDADTGQETSASIPERLLRDEATNTDSDPPISLKEAEEVMKKNYVDLVFRKELKLIDLNADPKIDENRRVMSINYSDAKDQLILVTTSKYDKDEKKTHAISGNAETLAWAKELIDAHKVYANKFDQGHQRVARLKKVGNPRADKIYQDVKADLGKLGNNKAIATLKPERQLKINSGPIDHFSEEIQNDIRNNVKKYQIDLDAYRKSSGVVKEDYVAQHKELQGLIDDEIQRAQDAIDSKFKNTMAEDQKTATARGTGFSPENLKLSTPQRIQELQTEIAGHNATKPEEQASSGAQPLAVQQPSGGPLDFLMRSRRMAREAKKQAKADQRAGWENEFNSARTSFHRQLMERFDQRKTLNDAALSDYNSKQFNVLQKDIADAHHQYQTQLDDFVKLIRPDFESLEIHVPKGMLHGMFRTSSRKQRIRKWVDFYYGKYLIDLVKDETVTATELRGIRDSFEARLDAISQKEDVNKQGNIDRVVRMTSAAKAIVK
jgi:hypothetical protein